MCHSSPHAPRVRGPEPAPEDLYVQGPSEGGSMLFLWGLWAAWGSGTALQGCAECGPCAGDAGPCLRAPKTTEPCSVQGSWVWGAVPGPLLPRSSGLGTVAE